VTISTSKIRWTALVVIALLIAALVHSAAAYGDTSTRDQPPLGSEQPMPVESDGGIGDTPIPVEPDGGIGDTPIPVEPAR
jgi:hypothetical protein